MHNKRAIAYQINLYDVQSGIFNTITALVEVFAGAQMEGTKLEILTYTIPLQDELSKTLFGLRIVITVWLTVLTLATLLKRSTFNALFSE